MLSACERESPRLLQLVEPEAMRFETQHIRREVDVYKENPSPVGKRRMDKAFAAFDAQVRELEALAQTQEGPERTATERRIANLQARRQLHWDRSLTAYAETMPVKRAEPVAERSDRAPTVKKAVRVRPSTVRVQRPQPVRVLKPRLFRWPF